MNLSPARRRPLRFIPLLLLPVVLVLLACGSRPTGAQIEKQKGYSYATWWPGNYSTPDADLALARLADTGATWLSLVVTQYQDTIDSTTIGPTAGTPTDADVVHAIAEAHRLGLKVMLKPHVDLWNDPGRWRGEIGQNFNAAQWDAWFASYRTFINHYVALAQAQGVEQFAVGVELRATEAQEAHWRTTVAGVRARFDGPITYAANHGDDVTSLTWWDAVDFIGVDAYYPLSATDDPTPAQLTAAWSPIVATLDNLAEKWQKPFLFTEIGYRSIDGANRHPWDWQIDGAVDLAEQAELYEAALAAVYDQPWFAGVYWWSWDVDPYQGGPCDKNYTIYDKPAEAVLRRWYGAPPRPIDPPPPAGDGATLEIYSDALAAGWENWSWDATVNFAATDQIYSGSYSALTTVHQPWGALYLHHGGVDTTPYDYLEFQARLSSPGQRLLITPFDDNDEVLRQRPVADCRYTGGAPIGAGVWTRVRVPLEHLNAGGRALGGVAVQAEGAGVFWVDDLRLVAAGGAYMPLVVARR